MGERAVWIKNGHPFVCHAIDGDECIGPFVSVAAAQAHADRLNDLAARPCPDPPARARLTERSE